jgi:FMN phosphatase YigB (HAD superfamily)
LKHQILKCLANVFVTVLSVAAPAHADQAPDWVFMDLGEVIVTGNPTDGYTFVPGALDLIAGLKQAGIKVALVSNIPESWGATCDLKLAGLQQFLGSRLNEPMPFDWKSLDHVILPPFDRYRKPKPFIFMTALASACPGRALFMGEDSGEIQAAKDLGFATIDTSLQHGHLPSVDDIILKMESEFSFTHPAGCGFAALLEQTLEPQDVGLVSGCVLTP